MNCTNLFCEIISEEAILRSRSRKIEAVHCYVVVNQGRNTKTRIEATAKIGRSGFVTFDAAPHGGLKTIMNSLQTHGLGIVRNFDLIPSPVTTRRYSFICDLDDLAGL